MFFGTSDSDFRPSASEFDFGGKQRKYIMPYQKRSNMIVKGNMILSATPEHC